MHLNIKYLEKCKKLTIKKWVFIIKNCNLIISGSTKIMIETFLKQKILYFIIYHLYFFKKGFMKYLQLSYKFWPWWFHKNCNIFKTAFGLNVATGWVNLLAKCPIVHSRFIFIYLYFVAWKQFKALGDGADQPCKTAPKPPLELKQ